MVNAIILFGALWFKYSSKNIQVLNPRDLFASEAEGPRGEPIGEPRGRGTDRGAGGAIMGPRGHKFTTILQYVRLL